MSTEISFRQLSVIRTRLAQESFEKLLKYDGLLVHAAQVQGHQRFISRLPRKAKLEDSHKCLMTLSMKKCDVLMSRRLESVADK